MRTESNNCLTSQNGPLQPLQAPSAYPAPSHITIMSFALPSGSLDLSAGEPSRSFPSTSSRGRGHVRGAGRAPRRSRGRGRGWGRGAQGAITDCTYEMAKELMVHTDSLARSETEQAQALEEMDVSDEDMQGLYNLGRERKRKKLIFFNGQYGMRLRLHKKGHVMKQQREQQYCALCGIRGIEGNPEGWRGHRSTYKCIQCDVHLCVRIYNNDRKSCSEQWHSASVLIPRSTLPPNRAPGFSNNSPHEEGHADELGESGTNGEGEASLPSRKRRRTR